MHFHYKPRLIFDVVVIGQVYKAYPNGVSISLHYPIRGLGSGNTSSPPWLLLNSTMLDIGITHRVVLKSKFRLKHH